MRIFQNKYDVVEYGCLFCRSGAEDKVVADVKKTQPNVDAIACKRRRLRRMGGTVMEETVSLFPGYVFLRTCGVIDIQALRLISYVYRLLTDSEGNWQLRGADCDLAELLFKTNGIIGFSKAYYEGATIRICEGFMKGYEGNIIRLNKRAKTAQIALDFRGKRIELWLGYELIERQ